ncbi:hypothetical protein COOONC_21445 [Cooperia oncophora]
MEIERGGAEEEWLAGNDDWCFGIDTLKTSVVDIGKDRGKSTKKGESTRTAVSVPKSPDANAKVPKKASARSTAKGPEHTGEKAKGKGKPPDVPAKEVCEFEKKAADEGIVIQPQHVKHMGNIDEIAQGRKEQIEKEVEQIKSDKDKSAINKAEGKMKVRINEKNCVLYETNDAATLDDQEDGEDPLGDLY